MIRECLCDFLTIQKRRRLLFDKCTIIYSYLNFPLHPPPLGIVKEVKLADLNIITIIIIKDGNASVAVLKFFKVTSIAVKWINFWCQRVTLYSILFAKMFCYYIHNIIIIIAILITRSKHTRKHFSLHINIFIFSSHFHLKWE